jgi:hypothetical protein
MLDAEQKLVEALGQLAEDHLDKRNYRRDFSSIRRKLRSR